MPGDELLTGLVEWRAVAADHGVDLAWCFGIPGEKGTRGGRLTRSGACSTTASWSPSIPTTRRCSARPSKASTSPSPPRSACAPVELAQLAGNASFLIAARESELLVGIDSVTRDG